MTDPAGDPAAEPAPFDLAETDRLLSTTRSVRRRLDLTRPVPDDVLVDCLRLATQAPTGGNAQNWRWIVVRDPAKRAALAELYRAAGGTWVVDAATRRPDSAVTTSAAYLVEHLHEVPVHVIPTMLGRHPADYNGPGMWDSIIPAVYGFMLALRSRGLGSAYTTLHLGKERDAAELLGIPYDEVTQVALLPVAYTIGTEFKPAKRRPVEELIGWDGWHPTLTERRGPLA